MAPVENTRALRLLGLAARARELVIGVPLICTALSRAAKGKTPVLVLVAEDCSANTKKRITDRTTFYGVPLITLPLSCADLAHAIGKKEALVAAVGVNDHNLATAIAAACKENN
jgi:ribosomal protein L7Ae-like RNA K-turn-binding protein